MNEIFNLSEINSKAETFISQLSASINTLTVAAKKVNKLENEISSQSNKNLNVSEKELKSQLEQARKEKEKALAKTNECISQLKQCYTDIQQFKNNQQQNLQILQQDRSRLSQSAADQYRIGERGAQQDIKKCEELIKKIESIINHAKNTISSISALDMTMKGKTKNREHGLPDDFGLNSTAKKIISAMNKKRYPAAMQPQYPKSSLGKEGNLKQIDFDDNVSSDFSYSIWAGKYKNANFYPYHKTLNENELPDRPKESLRKLRQSLDSMQCEYCRRTGTLRIEPNIYENRCRVRLADDSEQDEHSSYKVHVVCTAKHNTEYSGLYNTHVHCFYLNTKGKIGICTGCGKTHRR